MPGLAIRVYVSRKRPRQSLAPAERIPIRLRGVLPRGGRADYTIPTDVVVGAGELRLLALSGGDRIVGREDDLGTLGLAYRSVTGKDLLLTSAHVAAGLDVSADEVAGDAALRLHGRPGAVATIWRMTSVRGDRRVNRMDAAVAWIHDDQQIVRLGVRGEQDPVVGTEDVHHWSTHEYFYVDANEERKTFVHPDRVAGALPIQIAGATVLFNGFFTLTQVSGEPSPGDSGSILLRESAAGLLACGLVFAGAAKTLAVFPISRAFSALRATTASGGGGEEDVSIEFPS